MRKLILVLLVSLVAPTAGAKPACDPDGPAPGEAIVGDREGDGGIFGGANLNQGAAYAGFESSRAYVQADADSRGAGLRASTKPSGETVNGAVSVGFAGAHICVGQGDEVIYRGP